MIQVSANSPTSFLLKRSPLEQQAFFSWKTIFVPHVSTANTAAKIVHSSVGSHLKVSPGSPDAINIHFDQLKNLVAFSKSTSRDDFVLIV